MKMKAKIISYTLLTILILLSLMTVYVYFKYWIPQISQGASNTLLYSSQQSVQINNKAVTPTSIVTASSPVYRETPVLGNYPYVIKSGIVTKNSTIIAYVYINISKYAQGDVLPIFVPINVGSSVPQPLLNNPVINITSIKEIINSSTAGESKIEILYIAKIVSLNSTFKGGSIYYFNNTSGHMIKTMVSANSVMEFAGNTFLNVEFIPINQTVVELLTYIGTETE